MTDGDFSGSSSSLKCNQSLCVAFVSEHPRALALALFFFLERECATDVFPVSIQSCEVDSVAKRGTSEVDPQTSI